MQQNFLTLKEANWSLKNAKNGFLVLFFMLFGAISFAQSTANYTFATNTTGSMVLTSNGDAVDMTSGTTTLVTAGSDGSNSANTNIGFEFYLMGNLYSKFSVNANGRMGLGSTNVDASYSNVGSATTPVLNAFGGDLATVTNVAAGSKIHYKLIGTAPNRVLVVEWLNMKIAWNNFATALSGDGTFQVLLYENNSSFEFKYGAMNVATAFTPSTGAFIGFSIGNLANQTASIASVTNTVTNGTSFTQNVYTTGAIANLNSAADGSRRVYSFTPPASPANPTSLTFTGVTQFSNTPNWIDNSTDETYFLVTRATDAAFTANVIITKIPSTTIAGTGTTYTSLQSILTPNTEYFYKIQAGSEGKPTAGITSSEFTSPATTVVATAIGGIFNSTLTWVGGVIPPTGSDILIPAGSTVTIISALVMKNTTINGILQWGGGAGFTYTSTGNLTINSTGKMFPFTSILTGQTVIVGGDFINDGYVNFALSSCNLSFRGSQLPGGSSTQTLGGTGIFEGNASGGIIRTLSFETTGTTTVSTTQNLYVTSGFIHAAGTLNTGGKIFIDNTAKLHGEVINQKVSHISLTSGGTTYTNSPVVFGAAVTLWTASATVAANARYFSGNNVYLITSGTTLGTIAPTHTSGTAANGTATLLWIGNLGTLGNPFIATAAVVGTQYFYGDNLYVCTAAGIPNIASPPTHTTAAVASGDATFLYVGTAAKATVNFSLASLNVRSLDLINAGSGYSSGPSLVMSLNVGSASATATAVAVFVQSVAPTTLLTTQKSGSATISGGLSINSNQGASQFSGVGSISTTNGGVNYTVAPQVGFTLPTALNLVTAGGSGFTTAPTITVSGGTLINGLALISGNFTITVAAGKVVSVYLATIGTACYSVLPTLAITGGGGIGATLEFPVGCLPTATASLGTNGQIKSFSVTNAGFGYVTAPTANIGTTTGTASGGTFTTIASQPNISIGLYNLSIGNFVPSAGSVVNTQGAEVPTNNLINALTINNATGANFTSNLNLMSSVPLAFTSGNLNFGANTLSFLNPLYAGTTGIATSNIASGVVKLSSQGGSVTRTFPFAANVLVSTGSGSLLTGSSIQSLTLSATSAASGTVSPSGITTGSRAYRIVADAGSVYGVSPTVTLNYNSTDSLASDNASLFVAQATALGGPWTVRSVTSGSGPLSSTGNRATATAAPGPISMTGDDYFAFTTTFVSYVSAVTGNWATGSTWVGGIVPASPSENVFIANGHNVTSDSTANLAKNLTIYNGGTLTVSTGSDLTIGAVGLNNSTLANNGTLTISGGNLNLNGNYAGAIGSTFNQSGGDFNVDGNNGGVVLNSVASTVPLFEVLSNLGSVTSGTITIVDPPAAVTAALTMRFSTSTPNDFQWGSGHTTSFGNGISSDLSANETGFVFDGFVGNARNFLGSVLVNAGAGTNRWVTTATSNADGSYILGNLTVNSGSELRGGSSAEFVVAGNIVNNGTITTQSTPLIFATYTRGASVAKTSSIASQTVSGSGVFRNLVLSPTHNFTSLEMNNSLGVTFASTTVSVSSNVRVNGTSVINFASGKNLTFGGTVTVANTASLTFESNSNLIQTGASANSGNVVIKRNTDMQRLAYTYWASPVAAQNLLAFSPLTLTTRFSTYDEPTNAFVTVTVPSTTTFANAKGYVIRAPNTFADAPAPATPFTGTFKGVPNNGTITIPVTKSIAPGQGYNLVGNPYPCTLSATGLNGFFAANTSIQTIYYWTKTALGASASTNYATQNSVTGVAASAGGSQPNDIIQVGQGFIVLASATTNVTFNNAMKVGNNDNQFFRNANTIEKNIIKLNLTTATANFNQIAVGYVTGATSGVDNQIDAISFNNGNETPTMISSLINSDNYAIQAKGLPFATTDVMPLGFKTETAGSYTISTADTEGVFAGSQEFYLKDNLTNTVHNIKQSPYNFVSGAGTFNSRFQIVYQTVLGVSNPTIENGLIAYVKNDMVNIKSTINMTDVKVFDLAGRLVYEKSKINTKAIELNDLKTEHQMLLIQITADGKTVTKKIVY